MIKELPPSVPFLLELIEKYECKLNKANQYEYKILCELVNDLEKLKNKLTKNI